MIASSSNGKFSLLQTSSNISDKSLIESFCITNVWHLVWIALSILFGSVVQKKNLTNGGGSSVSLINEV